MATVASPALEVVRRQELESSGIPRWSERVSRQVVAMSGLDELCERISRQVMVGSGLAALGEQLARQVLASSGVNEFKGRMFEQIVGQLALTLEPQPVPTETTVLARSGSLTSADLRVLWLLAWIIWAAITCEVLAVAEGTGQQTPFAIATLVSGVAAAALYDARKHLQ